MTVLTLGMLTPVVREAMRGDALLCLSLNNKERLARDVKVRAVLSAGTKRYWSLGYRQKGKRQIIGSRCWTSGERTLASSGTCLEEGPEMWAWKEEASRSACGFSRITFAKLRNWPSPFAGNQVKLTEGLHGWVRSSWQNSNIKRTASAKGRSRDRWPRKDIDILSEHARIDLA